MQMNSKRSSRKLWRLIDSFFLLLPLIILCFSFVVFLGQYWHDNGLFFNSNDNNFNELSIIFDAYIYNFTDNFVLFYVNNDFIDAISMSIFNFVNFFLGSTDDSGLLYFLPSYFSFALLYELFSLTIQIVMWLPRWAKNKLYEWGDN